MKALRLLIIAALAIVLAGCEDDGDCSCPIPEATGDTGPGEDPSPTTEPDPVQAPDPVQTPDPVQPPPGAEIIASGALTDADAVSFGIYVPGFIMVRVEWFSGPPELDLTLGHWGGGAGVSSNSAPSPTTLEVQATQAMVDTDETWELSTSRPSTADYPVYYTVMFTPIPAYVPDPGGGPSL